MEHGLRSTVQIHDSLQSREETASLVSGPGAAGACGQQCLWTLAGLASVHLGSSQRLPAEAGSGRPFPAAWTVSPDSLGASSQRRVRSILRPRVPRARVGAAGALAEGLFGGKGPALGLAEPPSRLSWGHQCCSGRHSGAPWSSAKGSESPWGLPCLHRAASALPAPAEGPVVLE